MSQAGNAIWIALSEPYAPPAGNLIAIPMGAQAPPEPPPPPPPPPPQFRGTTRSNLMRWGQSPQRRAQLVASWAQARTLRAQQRTAWRGNPASKRQQLRLVWQHIRQLRGQTGIAWEPKPESKRAQARLVWQSPAARLGSTRLPWAESPAQRQQTLLRWLAPPRVDLSALLPWAESPRKRAQAQINWLAPPHKRDQIVLPWGQARRLRWENRPEPPPPIVTPPPPVFIPQPGNTIAIPMACLRTEMLGNAIRIPMGPWACFDARPRERVIHVINTVNIVRLPDLAPIKCAGGSVETSLSGYCIGMELDGLDDASMELIKPAPDGTRRKVRAIVNGHPFVAEIDAHSERNGWPAPVRSCRGRSVTSMLGAPESASTSRTVADSRNASQLMQIELDAIDDQPITLDFPAELDWLVTAGAYSYSDLTPIEAIVRIAQAAGYCVQSDQSLPILRIRKVYPAPAWLWPTTEPDQDITDSIAVGRSNESARGLPNDRIIVRGDRIGVQVVGTVTGEAGTQPAPAVVDPLITEIKAGRHRAEYEISAKWPIGPRTIEMPLRPPEVAPGLLLPPKMVRINGADIALVVSCRVTWRMSGQQLSVRQVITTGGNTQGNAWTRFQSLLPRSRLIIASVIAHNLDGTSTLQTIEGATIRAKGQGVAVGQLAEVQAGEVLRAAAQLSSTAIDL